MDADKDVINGIVVGDGGGGEGGRNFMEFSFSNVYDVYRGMTPVINYLIAPEDNTNNVRNGVGSVVDGYNYPGVDGYGNPSLVPGVGVNLVTVVCRVGGGDDGRKGIEGVVRMAREGGGIRVGWVAGEEEGIGEGELGGKWISCLWHVVGKTKGEMGGFFVNVLNGMVDDLGTAEGLVDVIWTPDVGGRVRRICSGTEEGGMREEDEEIKRAWEEVWRNSTAKVREKNWDVGSCFSNGIHSSVSGVDGIRNLYEGVQMANANVRSMVMSGEIKDSNPTQEIKGKKKRRRRKSVLGQVLKKSERMGVGRKYFDRWEVSVNPDGWLHEEEEMRDKEGGWIVGREVSATFDEWALGKWEKQDGDVELRDGWEVTFNGFTRDFEGDGRVKEGLEVMWLKSLGVEKYVRKGLGADEAAHIKKVWDVTTAVIKTVGEEGDGSGRRYYVEDDIEKLVKSLNLQGLTTSLRGLPHVTSGRVPVTAILDPSTFAAQSLLPLLNFASNHLPVDLTILYVPKTPDYATYTKDTVPVNRIYKLADGGGTVELDVPDKGVYQVGVKTPSNTEWSRVAGEVDADNLLCVRSGGGDGECDSVEVVYGIRKIVVHGQMYDELEGVEGYGGMMARSQASTGVQLVAMRDGVVVDDTVVMRNVGYFQLKLPAGGNYTIKLKEGTWGETVYEEVEETVEVKEWGGDWTRITGRRKKGMENEVRGVVDEEYEKGDEEAKEGNEGKDKIAQEIAEEKKGGILSFFSNLLKPNNVAPPPPPQPSDTVHVFSLATGHLYERFLKIMMLSVTSNTPRKVKFWLLENYLSPQFKRDAKKLVEGIGAEVEFVSYTWPSWLRGQTELQRTIWGFKILFLDVLFPQDLEKIIFVDADQVMRTDIGELWDEDLEGKVWAYTPFCETNEETLGFQFWREGYWKDLLGDNPYHISALYVVDLVKFRANLVGDHLRATYESLSADPNSLSNLDQDLPNFISRDWPIKSLDVSWLWCETWCGEQTKHTAKTVDLCASPLTKEPKLDMARRIISGELFEESWDDLDTRVKRIVAGAADTVALGVKADL